jgi:predicted transcriptional regulator
MGRPRIYDEPRVATAIRLPSSLRTELQTVAMQRDVSVNFLVTRAVANYLQQLPPADVDVQPTARKGRRTAKRGAS